MTTDEEIQRLTSLSREMIAEYVSWGSKIKVKSLSSVFMDITDFVNFRMETVESCLELIKSGKIADALGLCRSLLEHYLLLQLLCRGDKYFQLQSLQSKTPTEINEYLAEQQEDLAKKHENGENLECLYVAHYPREKKHLMYVFEGLRSEGEPDFRVPIHIFQFQDFQPSVMRLKDEDYFDYYEPPADLKAAQRKFRNQAKFNYRHHLSYDALIQCLVLNDLADPARVLRIEAHYTFLGRFLHPTHHAARDLHERSNWHSDNTVVGMSSPYSKTSQLLAACYVAFLTASIIDEIALLFESAPSRYITDAGTDSLRKSTKAVAESVSYFWFLDNEASLYDRFNWAVNHVDDADLSKYGGYAGIPSEKIKFEANIFMNFSNALGGWSNQRVGSYQSPLS